MRSTNPDENSESSGMRILTAATRTTGGEGERRERARQKAKSGSRFGLNP